MKELMRLHYQLEQKMMQLVKSFNGIQGSLRKVDTKYDALYEMVNALNNRVKELEDDNVYLMYCVNRIVKFTNPFTEIEDDEETEG